MIYSQSTNNMDVNLLPWRQSKRKKQKTALLILFLLTTMIGIFIIFVLNGYLKTLMTEQRHRNSRLRHEVVFFNQRIKEMNQIAILRQTLLSRMQRIRAWQYSRILVVHFFDELVKVSPTGIRLSRVQYSEGKVKVFGAARTNNVVSMLMRNIEMDPWFKLARITEIKKLRKTIRERKGFMDMSSSSHVIENHFALSFMMRSSSL